MSVSKYYFPDSCRYCSNTDNLRVVSAKQRGLLVRALVVRPSLVAVLILLGGCERWGLDRRMEALCKQDGGIRVHQALKLPGSYFNEAGKLRLSQVFNQTSAQTNTLISYQEIGSGEYRIELEATELKSGDPLKGEGVLRRTAWRIMKESDRSLIAEAVSYGRSGGDLVVIGHFSSRTCPERFGEAQALLSATFQKAPN